MKFSPEQQLQILCIDHLHTFCPQVVVFASMNGVYLGSGKSARFGYLAKMKRLGMKNGDPDLRIHWSPSKTLYVELKAKGNKPTVEQANVMADLTAMGFVAEWCDSFDEFLEILETHKVPSQKVNYEQLPKDSR